MNRGFLEKLNNTKIPCHSLIRVGWYYGLAGTTGWLAKRQITLDILRTDLLAPLSAATNGINRKDISSTFLPMATLPR